MHYLAVLGNPIVHSRSPEIHQNFARQFGIRLDYQKILVPHDGLGHALKTLQDQGALGCNITVPFKSDAATRCDQVTEEAQELGVVNTLVFQSNGQILGHNTDGKGLIMDLLEHQRVTLANKRILLLGIGGAGRGIVPALLSQGPATLDIWNRTSAAATDYALAMKGAVSAPSKDTFLEAYDLVLNATAAGLSGATPDLPGRVIGTDTFCYDLSYGPRPTPFLAWASSQGTNHLSDGFGMLVAQAAFAFEIWFGVRPDVRRALSELKTSS